MDESHRLIKYPMPIGYDLNLFNEIYENTKKLRNKLAYEIDERKYGVDKEDILSWFDIKLLHAFNNYYNDDRCKKDRSEKLKAFVINALRTYKMKIVKDSYHDKNSLNQTMDIVEVFDYETLMIEVIDPEPIDARLLLIKQYYKDRLSIDAYFLFELELNPPPYLITKLQDPDKKKMPKITNADWADYLGIPYRDDDEVDYFNGYLSQLRREINEMEAQCRDYFRLTSMG